MSKLLLSIATLATLLLFSSAYYTTPADGRVGHQAPSLTMGDNNLTQLRGQYVVVTFWASTHPQSRINNIELDRATRHSHVKHVSVNMDDSQAIYDQLQAVDGLQSHWMWHCHGDNQDQLRRNWRQDNAYCSFLIDPQGRIVLKDPSPADLSQL